MAYLCGTGAIVQGRYDLITPPQTAWELHKVWPKSSIHWIPDAGHTATVRLHRGRSVRDEVSSRVTDRICRSLELWRS